MDVNEKIVCAWLASKNYFIIDGIDYGQFHSDIDILAVNIKSQEILDCEVKIRTGSTKISGGENKQSGFLHFVNQLNAVDRNNKIINIVGSAHGYHIKKIFITTYSLLGKPMNRSKWINKFNQENIEVRFIEDIVEELEQHALSLPLSKNEVVQILRLQSIKNNL